VLGLGILIVRRHLPRVPALASQVAIAFFIGAAVMAIGGIVELFLGVKAERQSLERIAEPLTAT
jgi:hypothetical protein